YYSSATARWLSPDWAAKAAAVPYADFGNPQSLNLYGYVGNNPLARADSDGHCCDLDDVMNFAGGAANAYGSDNLLGAGRVDQTTGAGKMGAAFGDAAATVQGAGEVLFGGGGEVAGVVLDATGVGAVVGVPVNVVSAGVIAHGATTAVIGSAHLFKTSNDSAGSTGTDKKPHGNTAGEQPAELYKRYDKDGNLEKHGVSQDVNKRYTKSELNGGKVVVTDRGPRNEMLAKERQRVERNPGPLNKEPWAGKKQKKTN
ncbi:MAG: hypothetical protein M3P27_06820, partial [Acidobacteriota bacterium]|nr:hypothetical protein [Acidobacteriota bacterium]